MSDLRIRAIAADSEIQITAVTSTETVERARQIHRTMPTATAALGPVSYTHLAVACQTVFCIFIVLQILNKFIAQELAKL